MNKNLTIGVLDTASTTSDYLRRFYSWGYPDKITPGKRTQKYDIVIIPDGISAYVGMACFRGRYEPIGLKPMDNMAELFRISERGLEYYAQHSLIIGVGDGAIMLWNALGFKATVVGKQAEVKLIRREGQELDMVWKGSELFVEEWRVNNFIGVTSLWSPVITEVLTEETEKIKSIIKQVEKDNKQPGFGGFKTF